MAGLTSNLRPFGQSLGMPGWYLKGRRPLRPLWYKLRPLHWETPSRFRTRRYKGPLSAFSHRSLLGCQARSYLRLGWAPAAHRSFRPAQVAWTRCTPVRGSAVRPSSPITIRVPWPPDRSNGRLNSVLHRRGTAPGTGGEDMRVPWLGAQKNNKEVFDVRLELSELLITAGRWVRSHSIPGLGI